MAIISVISGAYTGVYQIKGTNHGIGTTKSGFRLHWVTHLHKCQRSTSFGNSLLESIFLGADWKISFHAREWLLEGSLRAAWPWGRRPGANQNLTYQFPVHMERVGSRAIDYSGSLVLTAVSGTPAAASPATLTAKYAQLSDGETFMDFDSRNRELPLVLLLYPYDYGKANDGFNDQVWFVTT